MAGPRGISAVMVAVFLAPSLGWAETARPNPTRPYHPIVDTGQSRCYGPQGVMECPTRRGEPFFGQDAQIKGAAPHYRDNGDGTITDRATGLTWTQDDSGDDAFRSRRSTSHTRDGRLDWREALAFCDGLTLAGHSDWRLPNAKELHSIVDYSRAPDVTGSAALNPIFHITAITDDEGKRDWPYFWTGTTHLDGKVPGSFGVYIAFGRAQGHMRQGGLRMGRAWE